MNQEFYDELNEGEIHLKDHLQFELKSEFLMNSFSKKSNYKQEFYFFIPNALQINQQTYSKAQFYQDQTNIIRYKTPFFTFEQLIDHTNELTPLRKIEINLDQPQSDPSDVVADELRLFAAIFKVTLREKIHEWIPVFLDPNISEEKKTLIADLKKFEELVSLTIEKFRKLGRKIEGSVLTSQTKRYFRYVDEIISFTIEKYFTILLYEFRTSKFSSDYEINKIISHLILQEQNYQVEHQFGPKSSKANPFYSESILYRQSILNQFTLDALKLKNYRFSLEDKHNDILGSIAAALAMFVYMGLLVWNSSSMVLNSFPFVVLAVFLYVIKDRLKEHLKRIYHSRISPLFPDFSTRIRNPKGMTLGYLKENFRFIDSKELPVKFHYIRNHNFHDELQALRRHESIIHYKREVEMDHSKIKEKDRRRELTILFRLNIHRFLRKANNAYEKKLSYDSKTQEVVENEFPRVYHLNVIIYNSLMEEGSTSKGEINSFRIVLDKNGIKRVEKIGSEEL